MHNALAISDINYDAFRITELGILYNMAQKKRDVTDWRSPQSQGQ
jgi:hypothetical protein